MMLKAASLLFLVLTSCQPLSKISSCSTGQILSHNPQVMSEVRCIAAPKKPYITLSYPFNSRHATYCSQGNANLNGSHSHDNILYAIDFLTPPEQKAGEVYAAHDGIAYVYNKCGFRKNEYKYHNLDGCGSGYGNHVRILHPTGYLTIYAHLSYITIKNKYAVRSGDKIGLEGISGNAGKRHLHFGLHRPIDIGFMEKTPGYVGASIPFSMKLMIQGKERLVSSDKIPCSNELEAPLLSGV